MTRLMGRLVVLAGCLGLLATGCGNHARLSQPVPKARHDHHHVVSDPHSAAPSRSYTPHSTTMPVTGSSSSAPSVGASNAFPRIVTLAMSHRPQSLASAAWAPTAVPLPTDGSEVMHYEPSIGDAGAGGLVSQYQVTLTSKPGPVSQFATALYQNTKQAGVAVGAISGHVGLRYPTSGDDVAIGSQIVAKAGSSGTYDVLGWREGQWMVLVGDENGLPMKQSEAIAAYLHTHFLPAPLPAGSGQGQIVVTVSSDGVHTQVDWQMNRALYQVKTYPATADNALAALAMAVSMRQYPG